MPSPANITAALFSLDAVYVLAGLVLWVFAALNFRDRANRNRVSSALFWLVLGIIFVLGSVMPHWLTGLLVLLMVGLDGAGGVGHKPRTGETTKTGQVAQKERTPGNRIFLPVLLIPLLAFGFALAFRLFGGDTSRGALVGLGFGGVAALGAGAGVLASGCPADVRPSVRST